MAVFIAACAAVGSGCSTIPAYPLAGPHGRRDVMKEVMACNNRLVLLSAQEFQRGRPVLVLLHGATDDPSEMMTLANERLITHNVFLYSYDYHRSLTRLARDFVKEMEALRLAQPQSFVDQAGDRTWTVLSYSYSALIVRKAVLLAGEAELFRSAAVVQLVPTAGGSFLARSVGNPVAASLMSLASKFSAAENPYGGQAEQLWGGDGNRKFYAAIDGRKMRTLLVEGDPHCLARVANEAVQQRYQSGIGPNVVTIPKSSGVTHENFPNHPVALEFVRQAIAPMAGAKVEGGGRQDQPFADRAGAIGARDLRTDSQ